MLTLITGTSTAHIAQSIRTLIDQGTLAPGDLLPPVRTLAEHLNVNRNTAVAAYRTLASSGLVVAHGRAGTRVARRTAGPQDGFTQVGGTELVDVANGNPLPELIPDLDPVLHRAVGTPVLYGEAVVDPGLGAWAREWMEPDVPADFALTVTSGAVDAIERLLALTLMRDDAVGLEDPCFLAGQQTVRLGGYTPVGIPVDAHGMTPAGLRAALEAGVRAVVCTPRAQNPTGASLNARRAAELAAILADYPYVLIIEDDYFSLLSRSPFNSIVPTGHCRWALVRSMSKFLGPDISVAVVASDPETAHRLSLRFSPGTTWVSHLLQRLAHAQLTAQPALDTIARAARTYAQGNDSFVGQLRAAGVEASAGDGISVWVPVPESAVEDLAKRGWLVRAGHEFCLDQTGAAGPGAHIRLTIHALDKAQRARLVRDIAQVASDSTSSRSV